MARHDSSPEGTHLPSKQIVGESENIPRKFLDNILQELRQNGVVDSRRGIFGGYFLARPASEIMLGDLIRIVDGPLAPIRCASLTAYQKCDDCSDEASCDLRRLMRDVRDAMAAVLDRRSLADLIVNPDLIAA